MVSIGECPAGKCAQNIREVKRPASFVGAADEFLFQRVHKAVFEGSFPEAKISRIFLQHDRPKIIAPEARRYRVTEVRGVTLGKAFCPLPIAGKFVLCLVTAGLNTSKYELEGIECRLNKKKWVEFKPTRQNTLRRRC